MKKCSGCSGNKAEADFPKDRSKPDGLATRCRACRSAANAVAYASDPERYKLKAKAHRERKPKQSAATRAEWAAANKLKMAAYRKAWRAKNRAAERASAKEAEAVKRRTSPTWRLSRAVSRAVWGSLRGRKEARAWQELVGFTADELRTHLEQSFAPGMSWANYGDWHVDHIRPVASFSFQDYSDPEFKACWALSNLQPLWAEDNIRKGARVAIAV